MAEQGKETSNTITVGSSDVGQRLDVWLCAELPDMSRSRIQSLIKAGNITLDGRAVRAHDKTVDGMSLKVSVPPPASVDIIPEDIPLDVIFEDSDIIVVNKPAGMVVHPSAGHASGTFVNALLFHVGDLAGIGGELRPGIVHRLDKDTTGVLLAAKNDTAFKGVAAQFKEREVKKEYLAVVHGTPSPSSGRIETEIGRSSHDRKKMSVSPASGGRIAISNYEVIETLGPASLVRVGIETGRTHQIRLHLQHISHHVVGDRTYGRKKAPECLKVERQMLHAAKLSLHHPTGNSLMEFEAPVPEDMENLLKALRDNELGV